MEKDIQQQNFEQLAEAKEYYKWFAEVVRPWVGNRLLEVGCGQGNITVNFLDKPFVFGIDLNTEYLRVIAERFAQRENFQSKQLDITNLSAQQELMSHHFDSILCVNVIEHIEDEIAAARAMYEILETNGTLILLAPAFESLMSPYDHMVGHYRRYTKATLQKTMEAAGFEVEKVFYFNMIGALGWWVNYSLLKRTLPGRGSVSLLEKIVPIEKVIEQIIPAPFGISVIAIGRKRIPENK